MSLVAGAYNLYVNMTANSAGLQSGFRAGAGALRGFDGQLNQVGARLNQVQAATRNLARAQAAASAEMVRAHARVAQASQRTAAAQQVVARSHRAAALATTMAARAEEARTAALAAGERAARARALADTMASRAAAASGAGAAAAARTAAAAQTAASRAAADHAAAQTRAATATTTASRAATVAAARQRGLADAESQARVAAAQRDEAQRSAARTATTTAGQINRAEGDLAAARNQRAASFAQSGLIVGAVLGVGVANAIELEKAMANVMTISQQITGDNIAQFTDQIVELSTQLPQTAAQLAEGLYQVVSTGFDGAEAMTILEVAAMGAAAGLTTSETSARALLGVLKAYGLEAGDANDVMDVMFQTVNLGVISFEELAQQLGDVVPMAAAAGVEFDDLSSALAAITLSGIPAAEAATALNMLMTRMMKPTKEMKTVIKELGYESTASAVKQDGLFVVMSKLNGVTKGNAEDIALMFKDIRAVRAVLALAAADGDNYADTYRGIANEVERAGATQKAYAIQVDTVSGQWSLFANQARALGIDMGRALLPVLKEIGEVMNIVAGAVNDVPGPVKSLAGALMALLAVTLLVGAGFTKVTGQIAAFRAAVTSAQAGGAMMPAVMAGAGLAMTGLMAVVAVATLGYAAYSASKQQAKNATEELVTALKAEREEGESGAGLRKLTEQLTGGDFAESMKAIGVNITDAIDAVVSGGAKLDVVLAKADELSKKSSRIIDSNDGLFGDKEDGMLAAKKAKDALKERRQIWQNAIKQENAMAEQMAIVEAKIAEKRALAAGAWTLDSFIPKNKNGAVQYSEEMKALGKAIGDVVDPSRAFKDAQSASAEALKKAGKSADNAKVSLRGYMAELEKQLKAQRSYQGNLSELSLAGYTGLVDHFAELGVDSAPMLAELVGQLKKGKSKVADELQNIVEEDARRSTSAYRAGLEQLPAIAAKYGNDVARAWARASETNDPAQFAKVTRTMGLHNITEAVREVGPLAARELSEGMRLVQEVAAKGGADAAQSLRNSLMKGDLEGVKTQLQNTLGSLTITAPELSGVVDAFRSAGASANAEWTAMLSLIAMVSQQKGAEAASALTSALLSGDMASVKKHLDSIGASVQQIPGQKTINVDVRTNQPSAVTIPVFFRTQYASNDKDRNGISDFVQAPQANGSVLSFYANGGVRNEHHVAQIAPAGAWRVWAEDETGGEAYVPLSPAKRGRSRAIVEEVVDRFGGSVEWFAEGGLSGWSYKRNTPPVLDSPSGVQGDSMRKAKRKVKKTSTKGKTTWEWEEYEVFDLAKFEKNLAKAGKAAVGWRRDLGTVARRAGQDVADALEDMGEDGVALTRKMARGSSKYLKEMVAHLERLGVVARANLGDFTAQLKKAVQEQGRFEENLAKLAAGGYSPLAKMLADQGDADAEALASEAVKDKKKAKAANDQARWAEKAIPDSDMPDLLTIIGAVTSATVGIHAVADKTKLDEDRIIELATLGQGRIKKALGSKAKKFLDDLTKANKGLAYENGGILTPGIYSTSNGIVRFAEPSTGGEAFVPLGSAKRGSATRVLDDVATRFGYRLAPTGQLPLRTVDARPGGVQVVVVRDERPAALVGSMPVTVHGGDRRVADDVSTSIMRSLRQAQRGGRI